MNTDGHGFWAKPPWIFFELSVFSVVKTGVLFQGQVNALAYNSVPLW